PRRTLNRDQAKTYLNLFELIQPSQMVNNLYRSDISMIASQLGTGASLGPSPLDSAVQFCLIPKRSQLLRESQEDGPIGALYLAIQGARRAIHDAPDDPENYFILGEAYYRLQRQTRERFFIPGFPPLGNLRTVQAIVSYSQALRLNSQNAEAHV